MNILDYIVVAAYLGGLLLFGFMLRKQSSEGDYFLGGRTMGWFPLSLSTMATQLSAISFISAPAFVGLREGGGLTWLAYEFAVPLAMILVMFVIAPALYRAGVVSIYDYLERRFSRSTRILISLFFQIVRSFATGIMLYAMGLILQAVLGIPLWQSIIAVGMITLIYSTSGGMKAVVYSDAIQMVMIFGGLLLVAGFALAQMGGFDVFWRQVDPARLVAVDVQSLGFNNDEFGLLPMIFGGFVLYASYYGCDQTQAQRILSSKSLADARTVLLGQWSAALPAGGALLLHRLNGGCGVSQQPRTDGKNTRRQTRLHDAGVYSGVFAQRHYWPAAGSYYVGGYVVVELNGELSGGCFTGRPQRAGYQIG